MREKLISNGHSKLNGHANGHISPPAVLKVALGTNGRKSLFKRTAVGCLILLGSVLLFNYIYGRQTLDYGFYYAFLDTLPATDNCPIPHPNPWDPTILQYISTPDPLECKKLQADLTYLDFDGNLRLNETALKLEGFSHLECQWRCFDRKGQTDDIQLEYGTWATFELNVSVPCEFVEVSCVRPALRVSAYSVFHSQVVPKKTKPPLTTGNQLGFQPSVLLMVIDSVSRSNFVRSLPKTLAYLEKELGAVVFSGFNKVGDNSYPNAVAMLAGKSVRSSYGPSELPGDYSQTSFDDWPLVWKDFANAGYQTLYAEDYPEFNLFNYLANGFIKQPTHHYFRPFWLAAWPSWLHRRSTHLCYGSTPKHRLQLNFVLQMFRKYPFATPKFAFTWLTELGHDWMNQVNVGDEDLTQHLKDLRDYLNETILFVLSDHGHRFDAIRESVIGRLEERLPFFSVAIPKAIRLRYPEIMDNLRNNSEILTSPYDLHETLMDIVVNMGVAKDFHSQLHNRTRGQSLFRPIGADRNCEAAGVPQDFCACLQETAVNTSDVRVVRGATALVDRVNQLLVGQRHLCVTLVLAEIKNAQLILPNIHAVRDSGKSVLYGGKTPSGFFVDYRVTVLTTPSRAIFEGSLRYSVAEDQFSVFGDINRINRYGNQSDCVKDPVLRKYCYCLDQSG